MVGVAGAVSNFSIIISTVIYMDVLRISSTKLFLVANTNVLRGALLVSRQLARSPGPYAVLPTTWRDLDFVIHRGYMKPAPQFGRDLFVLELPPLSPSYLKSGQRPLGTMSWTRCDDDDPPTVINVRRGSADTPELEVLHEFFRAVTTGDLERLKRAISPELDLETLFGDEWDAYTALRLSLRYLDILGFLLALGANPFALSYPGHEQPIHAAAARGNTEAVQVLLDAGADVNSSFAMYAALDPKPTTALWAALYKSNRVHYDDGGFQDWIGTIDLLVSRGAAYPPSTQIYNSWSDACFEPLDFVPHIPQEEDTLV